MSAVSARTGIEGKDKRKKRYAVIICNLFAMQMADGHWSRHFLSSPCALTAKYCITLSDRGIKASCGLLL